MEEYDFSDEEITMTINGKPHRALYPRETIERGDVYHDGVPVYDAAHGLNSVSPGRYREIPGVVTQEEYDTVVKSLADCEKELDETQFDLSEETKENQLLRDQVDALKANNPADLEQHCAQLSQRLQTAEAIIITMTLAVRGYNA